VINYIHPQRSTKPATRTSRTLLKGETVFITGPKAGQLVSVVVDHEAQRVAARQAAAQQIALIAAYRGQA
jgi:hypothetical protein